MQLALAFYGPMLPLYSVYDGANEKERIAPMPGAHIDRYIAKTESGCRKQEHEKYPQVTQKYRFQLEDE